MATDLTQDENTLKGWKLLGWLPFALGCVWGIVRACILEKLPLHYATFVAAGKAMWLGQNPYGVDLGTHIGFYFYSPGCGMFLFAPFGLLPPVLGSTLWMVLSVVVFVIGVTEFWAALFGQSWKRAAQDWRLQLLVLLIFPQVFGALINTKLELLMMGAVFWGAAHWLGNDPRKWIWAGLVHGTILSWKFQTLPSMGLLCLLALVDRSRKNWFYGLLMGFFAWTVFPILWVGPHQAWDWYGSQFATLHDFVLVSYSNFDNIHSFIAHFFGSHWSAAQALLLTVATGVLMGLFMGLWKLKEWERERSLWLREGALLALAMGGMFSVLFSPLGQNNAMVLWAPTLMAGWISLLHSRGRVQTGWLGRFVFIWAGMAFGYSDLMPEPMRGQMRYWSLKSALVAFMGFAVIVQAFLGGLFSAKKTTVMPKTSE